MIDIIVGTILVGIAFLVLYAAAYGFFSLVGRALRALGIEKDE